MDIERVVVVGGSMAGLAAAATLSTRAREVVVVERHDGLALPPQAGLPHAMLVAGALELERLFPGFLQGLRDRGAAAGGPDPTRIPCYWAAAGAVRREQLIRPTGHVRALCSRALIQEQLRRAVAALPNVTWQHGTVATAAVHGGAVRGVVLRDGTRVEGDLVVDAGGRERGVPASGQLPEPPTTEVAVDIRYTAFIVERRPEDLDGAAFAVVQNTPDIPRMGIALPMEDNRWQVAFGGYFGETAPADPDVARDYAARVLADPVLAPLLERPVLEGPRRYTFRAGRRRHWEDARPVPGYVAVGDAVASFNPIYGQGMTSALLQARELGRAVDRYGAGRALASAAPKAVAKAVDAPWQISTGADFMYDATVGSRPRGQARINAYVARVMRAAARDDQVNLAFTAVQHLLAPPATLFSPPVLTRVLLRGDDGRRVTTITPATHEVAGFGSRSSKVRVAK